RSGARTARPFVEIPGITGPTSIPDVVIGESTDSGLAEQHRAPSAQFAHDRCVRLRNAVAERLGAPSGGDALGVEEILDDVRDGVQPTHDHARTPPRVGGIRLGQGAIAGDDGETFKLGTERFYAGEIDLRQ